MFEIERYSSAGDSPHDASTQAISQIEFEGESFLAFCVIWANSWRKIEFPPRTIENGKWYLNWYIIYTNFWYFPENMLLINGVYTIWILNCCSVSSGRIEDEHNEEEEVGRNLDRLWKFLTLIVLQDWRLFETRKWFLIYSSINDWTFQCNNAKWQSFHRCWR